MVRALFVEREARNSVPRAPRWAMTIGPRPIVRLGHRPANDAGGDTGRVYEKILSWVQERATAKAEKLPAPDPPGTSDPGWVRTCLSLIRVVPSPPSEIAAGATALDLGQRCRGNAGKEPEEQPITGLGTRNHDCSPLLVAEVA
jgi:hypothetical protein